MRDPLFEFRNLSLTTKDNKKLFNNISFEVFKGDKILLKGESGCGKSTLLKVLPGGVIPDDGMVFFEGEEISWHNIRKVRNAVFYVSQHPVLGATTPMDIICLPYTFNNRKKSIDQQKVFQLAELFNMKKEVFSREIRVLSGGEKQRLAIIRAICSGVDIFLLDEITHSLDPRASEKVISFFSDSEYTVISVSHDILWSEYFTKQLTLKDGDLIKHGC